MASLDTEIEGTRGSASAGGGSAQGAWAALGSGLLAGAWRGPLLGLCFAALAPLHALMLRQPVGDRVALIAAVFFIGGTAGATAAFALCAPLARGRPGTARFSVAAIGHAVLVPLATAFVFFLQHRMYYAQWHGPALTEIWFWQVGFTGAAALYFFAVGAVKYIFPGGLALLMLAAALFASWSRRLGGRARPIRRGMG